MAALDVIKSQDFKAIDKLFTRQVDTGVQADAIKQYNVDTHDVFDKAIRPMRKIKIDSGTKDSAGNVNWTDKWIDVVRVGIPWQNIITERRVGFTLSHPVKTNVIWDTESEKEKQLVKLVERIQNDNKMDYKNKEILRRKLSELEVAVIWYYVETNDPKYKFTLNSKIVSPELGDTLYPLFDSNGTMISFRRDYKLSENGKDIEHSDIYTAEFTYKYIKKDGQWTLDPDAIGKSVETGDYIPANPVPNPAKKILVEYYNQKKPVWHNVQSMIDRHETLTSNHGGMNDKFGAPIFTVAGEIQGEIIDNAQGSVMQLENGATAGYANLASEPQSISLEQTNLEKFIHAMSQTPNISFDQMMTIGQMSGFAAEMIFSDPHMAVRMEEETFGIGLQRRLNIIKAAIGALIDTSLASECRTVQLKPEVTPYLPMNTTEIIDNLSVAVTGGIMSKETAIEKNPLVKDSKVEMERMKADATAELSGSENDNL
ncbi:MAG TPA: phage portal protein [Patescibacteria group bacterium]|nr:phage portal protein [Patescibacteria group bacterium]